MKMRRVLSALLILCCGMMVWGCSNNSRIEIQARVAYFVEELEPFAFSKTEYKRDGSNNLVYDDKGKLILVDTYAMEDDDHSYLEFAEDFKSMYIKFETNKDGRIDFVITSGSPKSGNIRGTAARIIPDGPDMGKLARYSFWSDKTSIYLRTLVSYRIGTEYDESHQVITIERNRPVAQFARTDPWLGGGG